MALTDKWLKAHHGKEHEKLITKSDRDSMSARVTPTGKVIFQLRYRYNGKQDRMDLGSYPAMSLREARLAALQARDELADGHNPKLIKRAKINQNLTASTLEEFFRQWFDNYCIENKVGSDEIIRSFEIHVFPTLGSLPVDSVKLHSWLNVLEPLSKVKPAIAARVLSNSKQALKWGLKRQLIAENVIRDITSTDIGVEKQSTDRILSDSELKLVWNASEKSRMAKKNELFFKLCLFFACRNGELRKSKVSDFDFDGMVWTVPPENHKIGKKTKRPLKRPFNKEVMELIKLAVGLNNGSEFLFTNHESTEMMGRSSTTSLPTNLITYIKRHNSHEMPRWSMHDLRRTARTNFSNLTEPHIAELMVGHRLPGATRDVYDRYEYIDEQREAYNRWWTRLQVIISDGNVVEFVKVS